MPNLYDEFKSSIELTDSDIIALMCKLDTHLQQSLGIRESTNVLDELLHPGVYDNSDNDSDSDCSEDARILAQLSTTQHLLHNIDTTCTYFSETSNAALSNTLKTIAHDFLTTATAKAAAAAAAAKTAEEKTTEVATTAAAEEKQTTEAATSTTTARRPQAAASSRPRRTTTYLNCLLWCCPQRAAAQTGNATAISNNQPAEQTASPETKLGSP